MEQKYIAAIEIGSSKIKGAVGVANSDGELTVLAVEEEKLNDSVVRYGSIQNVTEAGNSISRIVRLLENKNSISPRKIKGVYVSVGGRSLASVTRQVQRRLPDELEITDRIIEQIKDEARTASIPDKDIVDVLPRSFIVDNQPTQNPVGIFGQNINSDLNLIVCRSQIKRNINRAVYENLKLDINGFIVRPIAIANLVLSDDEKRLGCMLVDMGAETTTISIYKNGALQYLSTLPLGSRNITRDIAFAISCLEERAEEIKKTVGNAVATDKKTFVEGIDAVKVNNYVQARATEIILNILEQISYAGYAPADIPGGIIVVGGGAKLEGMSNLLGTQCGMKVRSGAPAGMIRFSDSRIQLNDSIDVISILLAASRSNPIECCTDLPVEDTAATVVTTTTANSDEMTEGWGEDEPKKPQRPSFIQRIKGRLANLLEEPVEDEDYEDEDEDINN